MSLSDDLKKYQKSVADQAKAVEKVAENSTIGKVARRSLQFTLGLDWLSQKMGPFYKVISWPIRKTLNGYWFCWDWYVYDRLLGNPPKFSRKRAGVMIAVTAFVGYFLVLPTLGFMFDAGMYAVTAKRNETVFLFNSQEIDNHENIHSVQGCYKLPCTDDDSIYFRIRATPFNEAWTIINRGTLYFPDYIAAAVPVTISNCTITSYGVRFKLFMRSTDIYPDLLESTCHPVKLEK